MFFFWKFIENQSGLKWGADRTIFFSKSNNQWCMFCQNLGIQEANNNNGLSV